jgi:hypothetical protein
MPLNGRQAKSQGREFAEPPNDTVEQYAVTCIRDLQCGSHIHRIGANP